jgi:protein-S-isoprenylcysteine O-methyltransferase Ste14
MAVSILSVFVGGTAYWTSSFPFVGATLWIFGVALVAFGATGRAWATSYISGHKQKRLIRTGPYSICRNPLYFFSMILSVGIGFCTETLTIPLLIFFSMAVLYFFQIKREERRLSQIFGKEYKAYLVTTPRFLPTIRNYSEPKMICISPKPFMKGMFGIAFLLLLIAILKFLAALHETELLPTYFHIY